jgi:hypothetical protein
VDGKTAAKTAAIFESLEQRNGLPNGTLMLAMEQSKRSISYSILKCLTRIRTRDQLIKSQVIAFRIGIVAQTN